MMTSDIPEFYTLDDVASVLRIEPEWLKKWLKKNPFSRDAQSHYNKAGRTLIFTIRHLTLIYYQLRDVGVLNEPIDIWNGIHHFIDRPAPGERDGFIYFIASADAVKIGYSSNLEGRFRKMATDASARLELLHVEPGTMNQEKLFHRHFEAIRSHGEWFRKTPDLLAFIEQRKSLRQTND
jgi:T5orf172 domain